MLKSAAACLSVLCAVAPFASACVEAAPGADLPPEATLFNMQPDSADGAAPSADPLNTGSSYTSAPAKMYLYPPQSNPFGQSYEEWAADWWQWVLAIPKDTSPQLGGPCNEGQSGEVFFLGGNYGGTESRICSVPLGKKLFFPVLNAVSANCPEYAGGSYTCENAMDEDRIHSAVTNAMDYDHTLLLEIDGVSINGLSNYRFHPATFTSTSPEDMADSIWPTCSGPIRANVCGVPVGSDRSVATDGYWVMLRPLTPGTHQIRFAASVTVGGQTVFSLDISYTIIVTP